MISTYSFLIFIYRDRFVCLEIIDKYRIKFFFHIIFIKFVPFCQINTIVWTKKTRKIYLYLDYFDNLNYSYHWSTYYCKCGSASIIVQILSIYFEPLIEYIHKERNKNQAAGEIKFTRDQNFCVLNPWIKQLSVFINLRRILLSLTYLMVKI